MGPAVNILTIPEVADLVSSRGKPVDSDILGPIEVLPPLKYGGQSCGSMIQSPGSTAELSNRRGFSATRQSRSILWSFEMSSTVSPGDTVALFPIPEQAWGICTTSPGIS